MACSAIASRVAASMIGAAAGRHHLLPAAEQAGDDPALALTELGFAVPGENVRDRHSGGGFDFAVGVGEGQAEAAREPAPDRGLAGAHHADEHERTPAEARDERARIAAQRLGGRRTIHRFALFQAAAGLSYRASTMPRRRI